MHKYFSVANFSLILFSDLLLLYLQGYHLWQNHIFMLLKQQSDFTRLNKYELLFSASKFNGNNCINGNILSLLVQLLLVCFLLTPVLPSIFHYTEAIFFYPQAMQQILIKTDQNWKGEGSWTNCYIIMPENCNIGTRLKFSLITLQINCCLPLKPITIPWLEFSALHVHHSIWLQRALSQTCSIPVHKLSPEADSYQSGFSETGKYLQVFPLCSRWRGGVLWGAPVEAKHFILMK